MDNRAISIDFAQDKGQYDDTRGRYGHAGAGSYSTGGGSAAHEQKKSDWLCNACQMQNFARRTECYRCGQSKSDLCMNITSDPYSDMVIKNILHLMHTSKFHCSMHCSTIYYVPVNIFGQTLSDSCS